MCVDDAGKLPRREWWMNPSLCRTPQILCCLPSTHPQPSTPDLPLTTSLPTHSGCLGGVDWLMNECISCRTSRDWGLTSRQLRRKDLWVTRATSCLAWCPPSQVLTGSCWGSEKDIPKYGALMYWTKEAASRSLWPSPHTPFSLDPLFLPKYRKCFSLIFLIYQKTIPTKEEHDCLQSSYWNFIN